MSKTTRALESLKQHAWARELVQLIDTSGGVRHAPQGYLFEVRFGFELSLACPNSAIQYEFLTGIGDTSVDFRLEHDGLTWLIELVSLEETTAIQSLRASSCQEPVTGVYTEAYTLSHDASNPRETPLAELIHIGERIEDKVWNKKRRQRVKFPEPPANQGHVILVNMTGFEGTGDPDGDHCREIVFGSTGTRAWRSDPNTAIVGLFDPLNTRPGARELLQRIHVIAFVAERPGCDDDQEIRRTSFFLANPMLNGRAILQRFPCMVTGEHRDPLYGKDGGA